MKRTLTAVIMLLATSAMAGDSEQVKACTGAVDRIAEVGLDESEVYQKAGQACGAFTPASVYARYQCVWSTRAQRISGTCFTPLKRKQ